MRRMILFAALLSLFLPVASLAQGASVTIIHGISGGALGLDADLPVDIWVEGAPLLTDFRFTNVAGPVNLPAGTYGIEVFLAGSDPEETDPVLNLDATLGNGDDVTIVAHLTPGPDIALTPFVNNNTEQIDDVISPRISERSVRLTVRHAAEFPRVAINRLVSAFEPTLINGETLSVDLDAGTYRFWLSRAGAVRPLSAQPIEVSLEDDTSYFVYAIGSPADGSFQLLITTSSLP